MLMVVGSRVSPLSLRLHRNTGNREKTHTGRKMSSKNDGKKIDPSHLAGYQDQDVEYYETGLSFEELFQGHLRNVTRQQEEDHRDVADHEGRLSPLIKLKLNPRIVN